MFGYHDSNRCGSDLWSPVTAHSYNENADACQSGYGVWENTSYHTAIENRAFSAYAKHSQEVEDVINMIGGGYYGELECDDDMSADDIEYIENEVFRRYGITCNLT